MSKLRSDELVNMEGDGSPSFPYGATSTEPTLNNHVATKSYVDNVVANNLGNVVSLTAPANPVIGNFWTDTSVSPSALKVWNGSVWLELIGEVAQYSGIIGSPVEVSSPVDGIGVGGGSNVTPMTDVVTDVTTVVINGKLNSSEFPLNMNDWQNMACCYGNDRLVVMGDGEVAWSDDDGYTWTKRLCDSISANQMIFNGTHFICAGYSGVMYSSNGEQWTPSTVQTFSSPNNNFYAFDITFDPSNGRVVIAGSHGSSHNQRYDNAKPHVQYSNDDGVTFTSGNVTQYKEYTFTRGVCFANGKFVTAPYYQTPGYYSTDGINWTQSPSGAGGYTSSNLVYDEYNNRFITSYYYPGRNDRGYYESFNGVNWSYYGIGMKDDPANSGYNVFTSTAAGFGTVIFGYGYSYSNVYHLAYHGLDHADQFTNNGWAWKRANGYPYDAPVKVWFTGNRFIAVVRDQKNGQWYFCLYRKGDPTQQPASYHQAPWFTTHYNNSLQPSNYFYDKITLASDKVYDADNGNSEMSGEQLGDWFVRASQNYHVVNTDGTDPGSNPQGGFMNMYPFNVNGDSVQLNDGFNRSDIEVGQRFKWQLQATVYGPSPSDVVFTSKNANSAAVTATDATVAFRKWTLETRASSSDPWTVVTEADDYDIVASQDGSTPWSGAPALQPNTLYRVKVSYYSSEAKEVESAYTTFETGPAS